MTAMKMSIKADGLKDVLSGLKTKSDSLKNMNPFWRSVGEYLVKSTIKRFDSGQAPDGTAWEPLKTVSETRAKRASQGKNTRRKGQMKPLNDTGALRQSIHYQPSGNSVTVGTNLKYAPVHQYGADIKVTPKMRAYLHSQGIHLRKSTNEIHIPARPFLGVSGSDLAVIRLMLMKHIGG